MSLAPVTAGQKFRPSAKAWNAFLRAAAAQDGSIHDRLDRVAAELGSRSVVRVLNRSGAQRARYDVLGLDTPVITETTNLEEFSNRVLFEGAMPALPDHRGKFAVLLNSPADDHVGLAAVGGIVQCRIGVADVNHPFADIEPDEPTKLVSNWWGGAEILYKESGVGTKWAIVRIGAFSTNRVIGKTNAAHAKGDLGSVTVWLGTAGDATESSSVIEDVYNRWGDVPDDYFVRVSFDNGGPELDVREC